MCLQDSQGGIQMNLEKEWGKLRRARGAEHKVIHKGKGWQRHRVGGDPIWGLSSVYPVEPKPFRCICIKCKRNQIPNPEVKYCEQCKQNLTLAS